MPESKKSKLKTFLEDNAPTIILGVTCAALVVVYHKYTVNDLRITSNFWNEQAHAIDGALGRTIELVGESLNPIKE